MSLKAAGNITDISAKIERVNHGNESSGAEVKEVSQAVNKVGGDGVKAVGDIEKTAAEVQGYLKNLSEDKETLEEVIKFINSDLETNNTKVEFSFNDKINQMMVQVTDKNTGEVIRSLPPEHLVKLMEKFREDGSLDGVFLSEQI